MLKKTVINLDSIREMLIQDYHSQSLSEPSSARHQVSKNTLIITLHVPEDYLTINKIKN